MEEKKRYESAYSFHSSKVNELSDVFHLRIVLFDGHVFDDGMPITPLNADEFATEDKLLVQQTIEPTVITEDGQIIRTGTVILALPHDMAVDTSAENQNKEGK